MAAAKTLAKFTVTQAGDGFNLHIEDQTGQVLELSATRDQVDLIADTLDDLLSQDDSADEIEGGDEVEDGDDEIEDDEAEEGVDGKAR